MSKVKSRKEHDRAMAELTRAAATFHEQRIGQLLFNATGKFDLFYVTDSVLADALVKYREKNAAKLNKVKK